MGRKSLHGLPPGIHRDQHGQLWATLEGEDAKRYRTRYPGRTLPRRKAATEKEARQLQRQLMRDLETGRDPQVSNPTVSTFVTTWIDSKPKLKFSTARRYRQSIRLYVEPQHLGRLRLNQVMPDHVQAWVRDVMRQSRHDDPTQLLDAYTVRNAFAVLRAAFNTAVQRDYIAKNPCRGVELPRPEDEEIRPLTPEQVNVLLNILAKWENRNARRIGPSPIAPHRLAALYHVAVRCGLRQGELLGLRWIDVDLAPGELHITGQMQDGERTTAKSKRSHRTLPLSPDMVAVLQVHRHNQLEEAALFRLSQTVTNEETPIWNADGLVFCSDEGTPINPGNLTRHFKILLRRAELPIIRFDDLRHTYAALSIAAGVEMYALSRLMGHSTISVTADRYGHLYDHGKRQAVDALDRLLQRGA